MPGRIWYGIGRILVTIYALFMLKVSIDWRAPLPEGPFILAANHPSTVDPAAVTLLTNRRVTILIRGALFKIPLFGFSLRFSGHIPVVAGKGQAAVERAERLLKAGQAVAVFPEGEISPCAGACHPPHTGIARLALKTGAPVVPVGIHLEHARIHQVKSTVDGEELTASWYMHGQYAMTVGEPVIYSGDVADHVQVRAISMQIMQSVMQLSGESAARMEAEGKFPLVSRNTAFTAWRAVIGWARVALGVVRFG